METAYSYSRRGTVTKETPYHKPLTTEDFQNLEPNKTYETEHGTKKKLCTLGMYTYGVHRLTTGDNWAENTYSDIYSVKGYVLPPNQKKDANFCPDTD